MRLQLESARSVTFAKPIAMLLEKAYFGQVDCYQQGFLHGLIVALIGIDAAGCWDNDAVDVAVIVGIVQSSSATENIDGIVVPSQKAVWAEAGNLHAGVAFDALRKFYFESSPGFTVRLDC